MTQEEKTEPKPIHAVLCCARFALHVVRKDKPDESIELHIAIGSRSDGKPGYAIVLHDGDGNIKAQAFADEAPNLIALIEQLVGESFTLYGDERYRARGTFASITSMPLHEVS